MPNTKPKQSALSFYLPECLGFFIIHLSRTEIAAVNSPYSVAYGRAGAML